MKKKTIPDNKVCEKCYKVRLYSIRSLGGFPSGYTTGRGKLNFTWDLQGNGTRNSPISGQSVWLSANEILFGRKSVFDKFLFWTGFPNTNRFWFYQFVQFFGQASVFHRDSLISFTIIQRNWCTRNRILKRHFAFWWNSPKWKKKYETK